MSEAYSKLPEIPRGLEDYVAAAKQLVHHCVIFTPPKLMSPIPPYIEDQFEDTIDAVDETLAESGDTVHSTMSTELAYTLAGKLVGEDENTKSQRGYDGMRGAVAIYSQMEAAEAMFTPAHSDLRNEIDQTIQEIAAALATMTVRQTMDNAEKYVHRGNARRWFRKIITYLGLVDDPSEDFITYLETWQTLPAYEKTCALRQLARVRAMLEANPDKATEIIEATFSRSNTPMTVDSFRRDS